MWHVSAVPLKWAINPNFRLSADGLKSTGRLSLYQSLQTRGAYDLEYFSIANNHFLAVANHFDGTHRLDSTVYQWNGKLFFQFQKLSTNGASHFTYFKILGESSSQLLWRKYPFYKVSYLHWNGAAASLTDFKTYQLKVPLDVRCLW